MLNEKILKNEEKAVYSLRSLYSRFGYTRFKMSKFEEYDLYVRNKDFLISDGIITFTDTNGKLMALKPDVTLSIIKNSADLSGTVQKLYYDENVYRIADGTGSFKEITQTGLECIGDIGLYDVCEVVTLAFKSLEMIDCDYLMDISHAGFVSAVLDTLSLSEPCRKTVSLAIKQKSRDVINTLCDENLIGKSAYKTLIKLIDNYRSSEDMLKAFSDIKDPETSSQLNNFVEVLKSLEGLGLGSKLNIDFSIVNDLSYYSSVVFKGYIKGIPTAVLSGGRYDKLMKKMGKATGAVGFAVYLDVLERHNEENAEYDYDFVLIYSETADPVRVIKEIEKLSENGSSVVAFRELPESVRCRSVIHI